LLSAPPQLDHDHLYWAFYEGGGGRALRAADWKVVQQPYRSPGRLYNLAEDLGEQRDVATQHPDIVKRLTQTMDRAYTSSPRWRFSSRQGAEIDRLPPTPRRAIARFGLN
jgi:arylsulfatase A-like enzyme